MDTELFCSLKRVFRGKKLTFAEKISEGESDYLYLIIESIGSDCRAAGLPISGTACRDYFLRRILEDLGKSLSIAVIPVFPRFVLA